MLMLIRLFFVVLLSTNSKCKRSSPAQKFLDQERQHANCKNADFKNIMNLRARQSDKNLFGCLIKSLDSSKSDGFMWSLLGELFERRGERSKANLCYKESIKLIGKVSKYVKKWHYIGPFTIGKNEVDGDPIQDWNGIQNVSQRRWIKNGDVYYSELAKKGEIKWTSINMNTVSEPITIPSKIDWNELVLSLQSLGIAEWQGWIVGDFAVNEDSTILVQCLGASTVYVNNVMVTGDLYKRSEFWNPVFLKRGIHSVMIKLRSKAVLAVHFYLKQSQEKVPLSVLNPPFLPDLVNGKLFSNYISLPVQNLHHSNFLKVSKVSIKSADSVFKASLVESSSKFLIGPGQIKPIAIRIDYKNEHENNDIDNNGCKDEQVNLKVSFKGREEKVVLNLRCRKLSESFLFTFLDHDGSVQHGAAIAPLKGCNNGVCPTLLTFHGTTVPPQSQADSYKRMEKGEWVFGLDNLWVLAPTRHGAHNWEGPGMLTAMKAVEALSSYTKQRSFIEFKADSNRMVVAGHSMGGHGAWIVGIHYPDKTLALISAAGWIRKEDYGDSNLFFRHDVSTSHVNPNVKATMEACVVENDADKHVSNLQGIPVMIRTGSVDRTVHPYYSRRMYRLLKQQKANVTYDEIPNKEHWWWDTYKTNDGGVTNDPIIRGFAIKNAQNAEISSSTTGENVCDKDNQKCDERPFNKYTQKQATMDRNYAGNGEFTLILYNTASNNGLRGVRVIQQAVPFRQTSVQIVLSMETAILRTDNVVRISLSEPEIAPVGWHERHITIDEVAVNVESSLGKSSISFCRSRDTWKICLQEVPESMFERGPMNMGPARRIAESPFLIVIGTTDGPSSTDLLRQFAVYIANQFVMTSDAIAHVINGKDLDQSTAADYNLIVIGQSKHNSWSERFHQHVPLKVKEDHMELGSCKYKSSRTGALFLAPHANNRLALVLTGNSLHGIQDLVSLSTPTILPMARSPFSNMIPDFVITGPDFGARGPGGYLCAGFWGNQWDYRTELASCSC